MSKSNTVFIKPTATRKYAHDRLDYRLSADVIPALDNAIVRLLKEAAREIGNEPIRRKRRTIMAEDIDKIMNKLIKKEESDEMVDMPIR